MDRKLGITQTGKKNITLAQTTKHITEANDNYISEDSKSNMVTKTVHAVTGAFGN